MRERRVCLLAFLAAAAGVGCGESPNGPGDAEPPPPPDVRAYVAGAALDNLDAHGHFQLPTVVPTSPHRTLSAGEAADLAVGFLETFYANPNVFTPPGLTSLVASAEEEHGGPIDWASLRPGPRGAYFAETHLEPVPSHLGNPAIRFFGPYFLVLFYEEASPTIVVAVSAYATNLELDSNGFVHRLDPLDGGGEFAVSGIPRALESVAMPPAPETAVRFAFEVTGVKIVAVPVLGSPGDRVTRTAARWQLRLAEPVTLERVVDGGLQFTNDVYVGVMPSRADARLSGSMASAIPGLRLFVAAPHQPAVENVDGTEVPLRPDHPVDLHEVRRPR